jgi:hypothetical protein
MKTEFEADLSEAFAARAARVPVAAASRLRAMDYQPRERRLRAPVTVGAGVLAGAATAGAVLSVVLGGAAPAYAGWSASPSADTSAPSASAATSCQDQLTSTPAAPGGGTGTWQNVLTDVRGPFTVALFQNDGSYAACFTSSSFTEVDQVSSTGGAASSSGRLSVSEQGGPGSGTGSSSMTRVGVSNTSSGSLSHVLQNHLTTSSDGPYTLVDGRTQPGVAAVTLVLDDGQDVMTSVADGWFVAWWPGSSNATSAQVTTASGTATEPLVQQPLPMPPPSPQDGSGSSNSGNSGSGSSSGNSGTGPSTSSNP